MIFYHDCNLDIFQQIIINTSEPVKKLVKGVINFQEISIGCEGHQMSSVMVAKT
jgi:hypothetical protein